VTVVKHGNRAASGSSGSSDVVTALGVAIDPELPILLRGLSELKIAFLFAPRFHPGLLNLAPIRRQLPFRTVFNLVGPLCNPACPSHQVVGTPEGPHADLLADVLTRLPNIRRAAVVSACDGLDEVTLDGPTKVRLVEDGMVRQLVWQPVDLGLNPCSARALRVRGPLESAERIKSALAGEPGPVRDYIVANSAAALWITGRHSLREGAELAATAIDSGEAARVLERWRQLVPKEQIDQPRANRSSHSSW
jgi:anthranilate phosphoribosyltransferase